MNRRFRPAALSLWMLPPCSVVCAGGGLPQIAGGAFFYWYFYSDH